jgi:site-specific DNA-methyltransferase (adenine-specific)
MIHNAEFIAWAKEEAARIERGAAERFHACLCDPPYGLEFMGKQWDAPHRTFAKANGGPGLACGYEQWTTEWAAALIPLLYPGALVFCFGGTRTWHRLACGFEDAGFQIWDTLMWLHGQGFPKAQDISKLIDKANGDERKTVDLVADFARDGYRRKTDGSHVHRTSQVPNGDHWSQPVTVPGSAQSAPWAGHKTAALKPAWEPVLCLKAPTQGRSYAKLAIEFGSGALNVDAGRIGLTSECNLSSLHRQPAVSRVAIGGAKSGDVIPMYKAEGRYPANLALECTCEEVKVVDAPSGDVALGRHTEGKGRRGVFAEYCRGDGRTLPKVGGGKAIPHTDPDCPCFHLDAQAGPQKSGGTPPRRFADKTRNAYGNFAGEENPNGIGSSAGNVSRFFYCAKASRSEREAGCNQLPEVLGAGKYSEFEGRSLIDGQSQNTGNPRRAARNDHSTVKPLALCRWLATLLLPPESVKPRRLLVPFAGTGSEMIGALQAGWDEVVGIEQDAHYCAIARARIAHVQAQPCLFQRKPKQIVFEV